MAKRPPVHTIATVLAEIAILSALFFPPVIYMLKGGKAAVDSIIGFHPCNPVLIGISAIMLRKLLRGVWLEPFVFPAFMQRFQTYLLRRSTRFAHALLQSSRVRRRTGMLLLLYAVCLGALSLLNPLQKGVTSSYYANVEWAEEPFVQTLERFPGVRHMQRIYPLLEAPYSAEWSGHLWVGASGEYELTVLSTGTSELIIDSQRVLNIQGLQEYKEQRVMLALERGFHALHLRYALSEGVSALKAFVSIPGRTPEQSTIPLADARIYAVRPTMTEFWIGRSLDTILMALLILGGIGGIWGVFLIGYICSLKSPGLLPIYIGMLIVAGIVIVHFFVSDITTSFDSVWSLPTALSILHQGDTDLNEYTALLRKHKNYYITKIDGHAYTDFPIGVSVMSVPLLWLLDSLLENLLSLDLNVLSAHQVLDQVEQFIATIFVAITALLIFRISRLQRASLPQSFLIVFIFAFCTSAWSTASRALWQHGPSMLLSSIAIFLAVRAEIPPNTASRHVRLMSLPLAFAYVVRPTNSIMILVMTGYVLFRHRKEFVPYCLWSLVVAVPFLAYNLHIYHALLSPYYLPGRIGTNPHFWEALAGNLISPSRGLFIFSPILVFALYGVRVLWKSRRLSWLEITLLLIIAGHWLVISSFPVWWGGHSYGPRFFTDMIPLFLYFFPSALTGIQAMTGLKKQLVVCIFAGAVVFSSVVHYQGATTWKVYAWNRHPVDVALKLWDFRDLQFLQGFR